MDNQTIFEVAKYVENSNNIPKGKLYKAFKSPEVRLTRFLLSRKLIEKKMMTRENLKLLKEKNIYRESACGIDFGRIHNKLENVIPRKHPFSSTRVSPRIARLAKKLDFELRKKILRQILARKHE